MHVVWINKSEWKKPGPIVYMGLLNALAFAQIGIASDYFVAAGSHSDTNDDLHNFYGVEPHPLLRIHRITSTQRRAVYAGAIAHVTHLCERNTPVLVCTRELGCLPALLQLKKRFAHLRVLHETHDFYLNVRHLERVDWSARRRQWAERLLLPRLDGVICLTEHQRALYQQALPHQRLLALPLGSVARTPKTSRESRRALRKVAYIGHLHSYKGLEQIFALATEFTAHHIALHCFGGGKAQVRRLNERAADAGLADTLQFTEFMSPRALEHILLHEISIGIAPLQDTFYNRYLTCPVKILDFIGCGLPVVASDLPATRALLGDSGCYCRTDDIAALATRICTLLDSTDAYSDACSQSAIRAEALAWPIRAQNIVAAFVCD